MEQSLNLELEGRSDAHGPIPKLSKNIENTMWKLTLEKPDFLTKRKMCDNALCDGKNSQGRRNHKLHMLKGAELKIAAQKMKS